MIGAEGIIKSRMEGKAPAVIFIHADGYSALKVENTYMNPMPDLIIMPHEQLSTLDLRFLVGMVVSIESYDHQRLTAVERACIAAKAARVIGNYCSWVNDGRRKMAKLEKITDTQGALNWESTDW